MDKCIDVFHSDKNISRSITGRNFQKQYYVGRCLLLDIPTFRELAVLPSSVDWLSLYSHISCLILVATLKFGQNPRPVVY